MGPSRGDRISTIGSPVLTLHRIATDRERARQATSYIPRDAG